MRLAELDRWLLSASGISLLIGLAGLWWMVAPLFEDPLSGPPDDPAKAVLLVLVPALAGVCGRLGQLVDQVRGEESIWPRAVSMWMLLSLGVLMFVFGLFLGWGIGLIPFWAGVVLLVLGAGAAFWFLDGLAQLSGVPSATPVVRIAAGFAAVGGLTAFFEGEVEAIAAGLVVGVPGFLLAVAFGSMWLFGDWELDASGAIDASVG